MANNYFEFKQFRIDQENCAMKVCTDACILGAWFASKRLAANSILDIGAGTGLQMLLLAQSKFASEVLVNSLSDAPVIHGIELDQDAFIQLNKNLTNSKWAASCSAFLGDVNEYILPQRYEFIISNPPFFEGDLLSPHQKSNVAKHSTTLTLHALFHQMENYLTTEGSVGVLFW